MKLVSFNVNSIRARLSADGQKGQLEALVEDQAPDIIGLQETKVTDEEFPAGHMEALGYHAEYFGQKTHYGVALLSRVKPLRVQKSLPDEDEDCQRRFISAEYAMRDGGRLRVINCYFPQGENRKHEVKFPAKERFYKGLLDLLQSSCQPEDRLVLMGDMNVAPLDLDIGIGEENRKRWLRDGKSSFLPEERAWLQDIFNWGLQDTFRRLHPNTDDQFSWFDYRSRGFEREPKRGLRIDLILATPGLADLAVECGIDYAIRGMAKPSDHCPVWTRFDGISLA